jgi:Sulfotransferase family
LKVKFIANSEELGRLIGFSMDVLEFCTEDGLSSLRVAGWIAARGRGSTVNTIRIHSGYGGTRYGTAFLEVNVPRSDVVAAFPGGDISENCGFQGVLPVDGLGENFSLIVLAAQTNTHESAETLFLVGEILGQQQPTLQTPISSSLAPICLTCMGRTGSTALMRILNMHPDIVVAGAYPFETKYAQTAVRSALGGLKVLLSEGVACIGFKAPYGRLYAETRGHIFRATVSAIDLFYECIAQAQKKGDVKYFAEKCLPSFLPDITRDLYGSKAKEIILVRDPRDIFCSAKSFNRRRGYLSFGAENLHSDADLFRHFRYGFLNLAQCHKRREHALIIRYEDLILDQRTTISKVLRFLDVPDDDHLAKAIATRISNLESEFVDHMTSPTSQDSIGRWRFYEDAEIFEAADEDYLRAMRTFDYL